MARNQKSRGGNRSNNNNPEGRNQYSSGFIGMARERPATAAAVAAGAAAAGVFLWSRRSQISDQIGQLSDQIGEWTDSMRSERELETVGGEPTSATSAGPASDRSAARRSATGAGSSGSGTMSGGSLDTGPSGRGGD